MQFFSHNFIHKIKWVWRWLVGVEEGVEWHFSIMLALLTSIQHHLHGECETNETMRSLKENSLSNCPPIIIFVSSMSSNYMLFLMCSALVKGKKRKVAIILLFHELFIIIRSFLFLIKCVCSFSHSFTHFGSSPTLNNRSIPLNWALVNFIFRPSNPPKTPSTGLAQPRVYPSLEK